MRVGDFDFALPPELIAQEPSPDRTAARLLHLERGTGAISHGAVADLPDRLQSGDLLVVNNTRVFAARLLGRRVPSGGAVECLLIRRIPPLDWRGERSATAETWEGLMHPGQKLKPGARVRFEGSRRILGEVLGRRFFGRRTIRLSTEDGSPLVDAIDAIGHVPLPPYIRRDDRDTDRDRYQTVFASRRGSVAAPTAGLHFTPSLLEALEARGVRIAEVTLHVGYGTFQPVRVDNVEDHRIEEEHYEVDAIAADRVNAALEDGRRVIAVGTTTTRTLEAVAARHGGRVVSEHGSTDLFIYPGFEFRVISGLLTNFHLPRSSLLMLACAFGGRDRVLAAYDAAIAAHYRFYSYGDAMLIT